MAGRLSLPGVTLCAATSVNAEATVAALCASVDQISFGEVLLFTDLEPPDMPDAIRIVPIHRLRSSRDYSEFLLAQLVDHIRTDHCLVTQWDGFVLDAKQWDAQFLECDYIGAPWPQFSDGHDVGNGGFSLRSKRLLEACRSPGFVRSHPEDLAVGRVNRDFLERNHGIRFADRLTAERFAFERSEPPGPTFGFHGVFNLIPLLGPDRFWALYETLNDASTAFHDYRLLMRQLTAGKKGVTRQARLTIDRLRG